MLEKLLAAVKELFKAKGIDLGDNEAALKTEIEKVIKETKPGEEIDLSKLDFSKFNSSDNGKVLEAVVKKYETLEAQVGSLVKLMQDEADLRKSEREKLETDKKSKLESDVKEAVDYLINTKKAFPESSRDHLTKLASNDLDTFKTVHSITKTDKHFESNKDGKETGNPGEGEKKFIPSTLGNAQALKVIQEHQAQAGN
jgi:hypothetical protein